MRGWVPRDGAPQQGGTVPSASLLRGAQITREERRGVYWLCCCRSCCLSLSRFPSARFARGAKRLTEHAPSLPPSLPRSLSLSPSLSLSLSSSHEAPLPSPQWLSMCHRSGCLASQFLCHHHRRLGNLSKAARGEESVKGKNSGDIYVSFLYCFFYFLLFIYIYMRWRGK